MAVRIKDDKNADDSTMELLEEIRDSFDVSWLQVFSSGRVNVEVRIHEYIHLKKFMNGRGWILWNNNRKKGEYQDVTFERVA